MRFICANCVADEYSIIPAFILKYWNFKKFEISKRAKDLLVSLYEKPIIHIKSMDPLLKKSCLLFEAVIIRRKIHKIFDLMKCDKKEEFVNNTLNKNNKHDYFVLKENLFSLKDLSDINSNNLINTIQTYFELFEDHILNTCEVCHYEGGTCMGCLSKEILFAYNIETVFYCNNCNRIYHKACSEVHPCKIDPDFKYFK